jgi:hypothetical protein
MKSTVPIFTYRDTQALSKHALLLLVRLLLAAKTDPILDWSNSLVSLLYWFAGQCLAASTNRPSLPQMLISPSLLDSLILSFWILSLPMSARRQDCAALWLLLHHAHTMLSALST